MHHVSPLICLELIQLCLFLYHYTSTPMLFLEFLFYSLRSALDLRMKLLTLRKKFTILINSRMQEQYQLSTALGQYLASIGQSELRSCIQTCKVGFVNHESSHKTNLPLLQILKLPHFYERKFIHLLIQVCCKFATLIHSRSANISSIGPHGILMQFLDCIVMANYIWLLG